MMALALVPVKKSVKIKLPLSLHCYYYADDAQEQDEIKRDLSM